MEENFTKEIEKNNKKIDINISLLIYIFIAVSAIFCDLFTLIFNTSFLVSFLISLILIFILYCFIFRKKIKIVNLFKKLDLIPIIIFLILNIPLLLKIDNKFDTDNYHLYIQSNFFSDKINFDFFNKEYFFFSLGDRMNYIIRYFSNLRFGTILTLFTPLVFYFISKKILFKFNINGIKQVIYSSSILVLLVVNFRSGTYHIDNLATVFLLELFYTTLDRKSFQNLILYQALLAGISFGIKISNIILCILILGFELICLMIEYKKQFLSEIKKIKVFSIFGAIIMFIIPWISYAISNWQEIGNPFYPFLNFIFNSPYITNYANHKLVGVGPNNLLEGIFWPILGISKMLVGMNADLIFFLGILVSIWYIIINKERDNKYYLSIFIIVSTYIWIFFMYGYARYAIILAIIDNLFTFIIIDYFIENKKILLSKIKNIIMIFLIPIILVCNMGYGLLWKIVSLESSIQSGMALLNCINSSNYIKNDKIEIDGVWASTFNGGIINLVRNSNTPIYNLYVTRGIDYPTNDISLDEQYKIRNELIGKNVYTICFKNNFDVFKQRLEEMNVDIVSYYEYDNYYYQNPGEEWYIIKLNVKEINLENYIEYMNQNEIISWI